MSFAVSRTAELTVPKTLPPFGHAFPSLTKTGEVKEKGKFEWAGASASSLFCQWSNFFSASHWRMVWDIIRFNYQSLDTLRTYQGKAQVSPEKEQSIGQWLEVRGYGDSFKRNYLIVRAKERPFAKIETHFYFFFLALVSNSPWQHQFGPHHLPKPFPTFQLALYFNSCIIITFFRFLIVHNG